MGLCWIFVSVCMSNMLIFYAHCGSYFCVTVCWRLMYSLIWLVLYKLLASSKWHDTNCLLRALMHMAIYLSFFYIQKRNKRKEKGEIPRFLYIFLPNFAQFINFLNTRRRKASSSASDPRSKHGIGTRSVIGPWGA